MTIQAIHRHIVTEVVTFSGIPPKEVRQQLIDNGFNFKNGSWYKSQSEGQVFGQTELVQKLAA
jgi:hypothetical protein